MKILFFFFSLEKPLYLLNCGTLSTHMDCTAVTAAELPTTEAAVDGAAQGSPKKRYLQGANVASGLQTGLKRCQQHLELIPAPRKHRHMR